MTEEKIPYCLCNSSRKKSIMKMNTQGVGYNPLVTAGNDPSITKVMAYSNYVQNFSLSRSPPTDVCPFPVLSVGTYNQKPEFQCRNAIFSGKWPMKTDIPKCGCAGAQ